MPRDYSDRSEHCLVVYDIPNNRIRHRMSEKCLDYGLERFQWSAFWGKLSAGKRRELFHRLKDLLGEEPGRVLIQPVSRADLERRLFLNQKPPEDKPQRAIKPWAEEPGVPPPTILKL